MALFEKSTAKIGLSVVVALAATLAAASAGAQTAPGAPGSNATIPEKIKPAPDSGKPAEGRSSGANLSNKLNRTNGVIKPPSNVDPDMKNPVPATPQGSMPVIKPPAGAQAK
jgi:hypothetical protein